MLLSYISKCQDRDCSSDYMNKPYSIGIMVCQLSTTHIRFTVWNTDKLCCWQMPTYDHDSIEINYCV